MTDAEERNQWCEEKKATVHYRGNDNIWLVYYLEKYVWRTASDPDRNTAIDKARGVK
jgi:hypothetical protein